MPEVGNYKTGPWPIAVESAVNRAYYLDLPRTIIERLWSSIETPTPLFVFGVIEERIELIGATRTWIWEPTHGNNVPIGRLNYTSLSKSLLSRYCWLGFHAPQLREYRGPILLPGMPPIFGPSGVFPSKIHYPPLLGGGEVVFTAIASLDIPKNRPFVASLVPDFI